MGYETYDDYLDDITGEREAREQEYDDWLCEEADRINDERKIQEDIEKLEKEGKLDELRQPSINYQEN